MDMTPFAENTSAMFAEAAEVVRPARQIYLKPYMDIPEINAIRAHAEPVLSGLRGLVMYSNQLVALNLAKKSDQQKNGLLADYLQGAAGRVGGVDKLAKIGVSAAMFDSTIASIRAQKTFLDGIGAASPIVNAFVLALLAGLDELNAEFPITLGAVERGIETVYRDKRIAYSRLTHQQAQYLIAATWIYRTRSGEEAAVDSLLHLDPSLSTFIPAADRVTNEQLDAAEMDLIGRLERIDMLIGQLSDEKREYFETRRELVDLRINVERRLKLARTSVVVWGQSHRNLGAGIPVPAMINLKSVAAEMAKSAISFP